MLVIDNGKLRACLAAHWGLADAAVQVHNGGMNSATWFVSEVGERWVAKAVAPGSRRSFISGLEAAAHVEAAGVPAGTPVVTRHGSLVADVDGVPLGLLNWVAGSGLLGRSPDEQRLIGATLARVHAALRSVTIKDADRFHWVDARAPHLAVRPWVRPSVTAALAGYEALDVGSLSWGLLHTDPAPEAFRLDRKTGECGLIDWSIAMSGPLLYDLASAVMYVGGIDNADYLVEAYLESKTMTRAEVEHGLTAMLRFRWAVQADYFARRLVTDDLTGITSAADNEVGLENAHRWLGRLAAKEPSGAHRGHKTA
ncbi:phosphotransferase enzyme family protein [Micromonospora aurantiaca]|uniref:Phosphotransferase n=1 Tax=Micromonospora aurantiaca (nom. illeg.) TaxID=47850 RepID=A0ABQ6UFB1_9ACTN|nr:phosphotransferase [Micromonospora aurantiaca]KAB1110177.1 phosphotransferase [Micromonospora aurantiaca]UFN93437.1 phosphotransferase [Micromonospora aurantiaca]